MINFNDLGLELKISEPHSFKCGNSEILVLQYLPIDEKANLVKYVIDWALDDQTGCFSPIRTEVFFSLALCKWYAGIDIHPTESMTFSNIYDILETNGIIDTVISYIPEDEFTYINDLIVNTTKDVARYNNSAAGIIQAMSANAEGLDNLINTILDLIRNKEGLETLSAIKDVVGKD